MYDRKLVDGRGTVPTRSVPWVKVTLIKTIIKINKIIIIMIIITIFLYLKAFKALLKSSCCEPLKDEAAFIRRESYYCY